MTDNTKLDGATTAPDPMVEAANAGEFAAQWNAHTPEEREQAWEFIRDSLDRASRCFMEDHDGLRAELTVQQEVRVGLAGQLAALAAVIEQAKAWMRSPYDGVHENPVLDVDRLYRILCADTDAALREVRAKAWDEGAHDAEEQLHPVNPYRGEADRG